jgi:hypothetical protein
MVNKIKPFLILVLELTIKSISVFIVGIYRYLNRKKPSVLIYTDSRGHEINSKLNKKNPFSSYCNKLIKKYSVTVFVCPEKHTTIIDFLFLYEELNIKYDFIVLHCGVVDFSRRPINQLNDIYRLKKHKMLHLGFTDKDFVESLNQKTGYYYNDHPTASIYTTVQFSNIILPKLKVIENLIFIGCNRVLLDWDGTYWQERPRDINIIMEYCSIAKGELNYFIDLSCWNENDIKKYTDDNIHPNRLGYLQLTRYIDYHLSKMGFISK